MLMILGLLAVGFFAIGWIYSPIWSSVVGAVLALVWIYFTPEHQSETYPQAIGATEFQVGVIILVALSVMGLLFGGIGAILRVLW